MTVVVVQTDPVGHKMTVVVVQTVPVVAGYKMTV